MFNIAFNTDLTTDGFQLNKFRTLITIKNLISTFVALMEPTRLIKSLFWLVSCSGVGYVLLSLASSNEKSIEEYPGLISTDKKQNKKSQEFFNVLEVAQKSDKPFYRLSKEEIDKLLKRS
ncbi:hypothetical protein ABEB36_003849 [Hypothenemus hampei]|uniref:Uncharacterized protein n=1 Tax=Hypothenemus hampei TaxID=57062 RepID=A0ABD1F1C0_HYPHA